MKSRDIEQEIYKLSDSGSVKNGVYTVFLLCLISGNTPVLVYAQTQNSPENKSLPAQSLSQEQDKNKPNAATQQAATEPVKLATIVLQAQASPSLDHISTQELARFAPISTGDLLKGQAGVHLGDSNGGAIDVNIRGIQGQSRVAVTVDGAQQALDVYRGYGGMQNRSYIDPLLISSVDIEKGPSTKAGGAIGGSVAMKSLGVDDILLDGKSSGLRLSGNFGDNGRKAINQPRIKDESIPLDLTPSKSKGSLGSAQSRSGSIAAAWQTEKADFIAAYAERQQGNYYAGKHGREGYRKFNPNGQELESAAKVYAEGEEVLNSSAHTQSVLLKSILRPWQDHQLSLSYLNTQSQYGDVMPSDVIRTELANLRQYPLGHNRIQSLSAQYQYQPAAYDWINFEGLLWGTQAKTNQLSASFFSPNSQIFRSDRAWSPQENNRIGLELSNKTEWNQPWGEIVLNVGAAAKYERLKPQSGVEISMADRQGNKLIRDAERQEYSLALNLDYQPIEALRFWAGLNYNQNQIRDHNKRSSRIMETRRVKQIEVKDNKNGYSGYLFWYPDQNGEFSAATDPRLNNGIVFTNSNNPFDGVHYNTLSNDLSVTEYDEDSFEVVTGFQFKDNPDQRFDQLSPHFGVEYQFNPSLSSYVKYTAQSRLPSLLESSQGTHQVLPGADLKPELSNNWEVGFKLDNQHGLTAKLNYFNNRIDNFITRYYDPSKMGIMTFSNMDSLSSQGIELQSKYQQANYFIDFSASSYLKVRSCDAKFAQDLRNQANSWTNTADTPNCTNGGFMGSYVNVQNPPKLSTNLTLGTHWLDHRLSVGSRYRYHSKPISNLDKPWQSSPTTVQMKQQPVHLIDIFADYKINKNLEMNFSIQNLTDRYYLDAMATSFMPAPGRSLNLGFKLYL